MPPLVLVCQFSYLIDSMLDVLFPGLVVLDPAQCCKRSVHRITSGVALSDVEARRMESVNLASRFAPINSNQGVVCFLIGAGLGCHKVDFDFSNGVFCSKINNCCKGVV